ncbi:RHS repeat-associated core domain-containing protein, partial [Streptomyces sp. NPDC005500]|uniref:RHS repeat-associated core domain-containing protein n=1 Tax=Streptomyces sp. NPDC005500 TaxID=3155007 RepID=UPI0033BC3BEF
MGDEYLVRVTSKDATGALSETVGDRAGRVLLERFKGSDGTMRQRENVLEPEGWVKSRSLYHPVGAPAATVDQVSYTYDDLGRRLSEVEPGSVSRSWSYKGLAVTSTDARGTVRKSAVDDRGQTVSADDGEGTAVKARRTYSYGPFGTMTSTRVEGAAASTSSFIYDDQGALVSQTDAERGTTTSSYNGFGELTGFKDANGRSTVIDRDWLGRETKRTVTKDGKVTSTVTHAFDALGAQNRKGMLLQASLSEQGRSTVTDYSYDSLSRLQSQTQTMPKEGSAGQSESLAVGYTYDTFGRVTKMQYPKLNGQSAGTSVAYDYQSANGSLDNVSATPAGGATTRLWTALDTDGQDRLTKEESGDGVTSTQTLDWNGAVLDKSVATSVHDANPGMFLWGEDYSYDGEGNLLSRTSMEPTCVDCRSAAAAGGSEEHATEQFTYDPLGRVASAGLKVGQAPAFQTDSWTYNTLGDITGSKRRGTYTYNPQKPTQVTSVTGGLFGNRSYAYDAVGNQTTRPEGKVAYNDFDLPSAMASGKAGADTTFLYSADGERVRKTTADSTTTYLPGLYERHHARGQTEHSLLVSAAGRPVATLTYLEEDTVPLAAAGPVQYIHTDRQGSTSLVTANKSATEAKVVEKRSYDAFGQLRSPDWTTSDAGYTTGIQPAAVDQGYTGHDDDRDLDLVNMKGRIYDPELGRFLTPDPHVSGTNTTQAWNRYTYVSNNPLKYTDPTGYEECADCPIWKQDDGGSGIATEEFEDMM